jgi:hypothetical protein
MDGMSVPVGTKVLVRRAAGDVLEDERKVNNTTISLKAPDKCPACGSPRWRSLVRKPSRKVKLNFVGDHLCHAHDRGPSAVCWPMPFVETHWALVGCVTKSKDPTTLGRKHVKNTSGPVSTSYQQRR